MDSSDYRGNWVRATVTRRQREVSSLTLSHTYANTKTKTKKKTKKIHAYYILPPAPSSRTAYYLELGKQKKLNLLNYCFHKVSTFYEMSQMTAGDEAGKG